MKKIENKLKVHFEGKSNCFNSSDIDLFVAKFEHTTGKPATIEETSALCESVAIAIYKADIEDAETEYLYVKSPAAITFCGTCNLRNIQIIDCKDRTPEDALIDFDIDCVTFAYDGKQVYTLPRGKRAITTFCNFMDPYVLRFKRTRNRVAKYTNRGFSTLLFENCKHFPRCDIQLEPNLVALWEQTKSM